MIELPSPTVLSDFQFSLARSGRRYATGPALGFSFNSLLRDQQVTVVEVFRQENYIFQFSLARSDFS